MQKGADDDDEKQRIVSAMERFASGQEEDERQRDLMKVLKEEQNIE